MKITSNQFDNLYVRAQNRQCLSFGSTIEVSKEVEKLTAEDNSCEKLAEVLKNASEDGKDFLIKIVKSCCQGIIGEVYQEKIFKGIEFPFVTEEAPLKGFDNTAKVVERIYKRALACHK